MNHYTIKLFYEFIEIEPWVNQQYDEGFELVSIVPDSAMFRYIAVLQRRPGFVAEVEPIVPETEEEHHALLESAGISVIGS